VADLLATDRGDVLLHRVYRRAELVCSATPCGPPAQGSAPRSRRPGERLVTKVVFRRKDLAAERSCVSGVPGPGPA